MIARIRARAGDVWKLAPRGVLAHQVLTEMLEGETAGSHLEGWGANVEALRARLRAAMDEDARG